MRARAIRSYILASTLGIAACTASVPTPGPTIAESPFPATAAATAPTTASPSAANDLPAFARDKPLILTSALGGGVFVMPLSGGPMTQLATDLPSGYEGHEHADWSPDGQRVVFIEKPSERMWIAHLDGSATESLPACDTPGCDNPAWSPDGDRIAFSRYELGTGEGPAAVGLYVLELATGEVTLVVRLERPLLADVPRWSPDGTEIVFQVDRMDDEAYETGAAAAVVPVGGGELRYLTDFEVFASGPDWGWVTDEIVFGTELIGLKRVQEPGDETRNLYAVQPDGTGLRVITNLPDGQRLLAPRWTPDGSMLTAKQFDDFAGGGILVDPVTGAFEPFLTSALYSRPLVRPLPGEDRAAAKAVVWPLILAPGAGFR